MQKRKTKPEGLKEITSSLHKQAPGTKEIKPIRILECPPELGPLARQEWHRIVGELTSLGVLSSFDRGPLAAYCNAYALWIEASEAVQKIRRDDQIAQRISNSIAIPGDRKSAGRYNDANCFRVRLHPCEPQSHLFIFATKFDVIGNRGQTL
jgi:phage terminase small subunit